MGGNGRARSAHQNRLGHLSGARAIALFAVASLGFAGDAASIPLLALLFVLVGILFTVTDPAWGFVYAAALATLDVMEEERLPQNAAERGAQFLAGLRSLAAGRPGIGDVRGIGLLLGVEIVKRAVEWPAKWLANNGGYEGSVVVQEIKKRKGNEGFNAATGDYEDLVKAGVVDPKKVTRTALQNSSSIAGLLLTTECLITEQPEKEKPAAGGDHHGPGGMDM